MNATVISRLEDIKVKFVELNEEIAKPEIIQDANLYRRLTKHHADLREIVEAYQSLQQVDREIAGAKDLLNESDPEMQALAEKELATLEEQKEAWEGQLMRLLLPKDPNDERNVVLEVRAGTGLSLIHI